MPLLRDQGIGSIPWSPLARGQLTRPWEEETNRSGKDQFSRQAYTDGDRPIVEVVIEVAANRGCRPAQVALAWVLSKPEVDSPIIGATKIHHLADAISAVDLVLDEAEIDLLEQHYRPHDVVGISIR